MKPQAVDRWRWIAFWIFVAPIFWLYDFVGELLAPAFIPLTSRWRTNHPGRRR